MPRKPAIADMSPAKAKRMRDKIVAVLDARSLSQKDTASRADMDPSTLNRILSPRVLQMPSEYSVRKIAGAIMVDYDKLVDDDYGVDDIIDNLPPTEEKNGEVVKTDNDMERWRKVPAYIACIASILGPEETVDRLMMNSEREVDDKRLNKAVPSHLAAMVNAIGPIKALRRMIVNPTTGEISL